MLYKGFTIRKYLKDSVYFGYCIINPQGKKTFESADTVEQAKKIIDNKASIWDII